MNKKIFFLLFLVLIGSLLVNALDVSPIDGKEYIKSEPKFNYTKINDSNLFGSIEYTETVKSDESLVALKAGIVIKQNVISVNSYFYPDLNKPAKIVFFNTGVTHPILLNDDIWEKNIKITNIGGTDYEIVVSHFSTWTIFNQTWNGTHVNTTTRNGVLEKSGDANFIFTADTFSTNRSDLSIFGDRVTISQNVSWNPSQGISGKGSYVFNATAGSNILLTSTQSTRITGKNTTAFVWVNVTQILASQNGILGCQSTGSGYHWQTYPTGVIQLFLYGSNLDVRTTYNFSQHLNEWHSLAFTYDGSGTNAVKIYVDGVLNATGSATATIPSCSDMRIGSTFNPARTFIGMIDNLQVWDRALSSSDIINLNNTGFIYKYKNTSSYTDRFNSSDYINFTHETSWLNITYFAAIQNISYNHSVNEIGVITGFLTSGSIFSTFAIDGSQYNMSEAVAVPSLNISINFTDVRSFYSLNYYSWFESTGNTIQVYARQGNTLVNLGNIIDGNGYTLYNFTPVSPERFVTNGKVETYLMDSAVGLPTNAISLEQVYLIGKNTTAGNCTQISSVMQRAASCSLINSVSYSTATWNPLTCSAIFPLGNRGNCTDIQLIGDGNINFSFSLMNRTVHITTFLQPNISLINIYPSNPVSFRPIFGNATYLLNETESGQLIFSWYVNNILTELDTVFVIGNGSVGVANISSGYSGGDYVYFSVQANNTAVFSGLQYSLNVTVIKLYEMCGAHTWKPFINCTMFSEPLYCTNSTVNYTYRIYNQTEQILDLANLTLYMDTMYFFNFRQQTGDYIIQYCDNSTREIKVREVNDMSLLVVGLIYMLIAVGGFVALLFARNMGIRIILVNFVILMTTTLLRFSSWFVSITNPDQLDLISTLDTFYGFSVNALWIGIGGAVVYLVWVAIDSLINGARRKKEKEWDQEKEYV